LLDVTISRGSEIAYQAELDGALVQVAAAPKYSYEDETGAVAGLRRVTATVLNSGAVSFTLRAEGLGLLASDVGQ
jgi:hypothetical protein